jgi:hypothetical protein
MPVSHAQVCSGPVCMPTRMALLTGAACLLCTGGLSEQVALHCLERGPSCRCRQVPSGTILQQCSCT